MELGDIARIAEVVFYIMYWAAIGDLCECQFMIEATVSLFVMSIKKYAN